MPSKDQLKNFKEPILQWVQTDETDEERNQNKWPGWRKDLLPEEEIVKGPD